MATPGFLELQLDPKVSYGTTGGLSYASVLVSNPARKETRFPQQSRGYWNLTLGLKDKSRAQMALIQAHMGRVKGKVYGWRFRNMREYFTSVDDGASGLAGFVPENIPIAYFLTSTTMQLVHTRFPGTTEAEIVPIRKPDMTEPIIVYKNGVSTPFTLDTTTGIVTVPAGITGATMSWKGKWDTPCRFDIDAADISWTDLDQFDWESVKIMEIQV